jgi:hypothetical protein
MTGDEQSDVATGSGESRGLRRWLLMVWPAFLAACLLEALVFSMVDPREVRWFGHALHPTRQAAYTVAFFAFWLVSMACSGLVLWLAAPYGNAEKKVE